jgi:hypothetical protein
MNIINGSTHCNRCAQLSCIGDDGLCEDCRELYALREKVLMKQSRIDSLEAENRRLREALEKIVEMQLFENAAADIAGDALKGGKDE